MRILQKGPQPAKTRTSRWYYYGKCSKCVVQVESFPVILDVLVNRPYGFTLSDVSPQRAELPESEFPNHEDRVLHDGIFGGSL